jgi:type I restriction enzyme S subunit
MHRDITSFLTRQGATRYKLTKASLEKLPLTLPPLPEQKKIAQILSTWDNAITTTKQLIANSQQQKKALMQQLLTGKKRLLDENGVRFSGEWKVVHLEDVAVIDSGFAFKSNDFTECKDGVPVIKMSDFKDGGLDISQATKVSKKAVESLAKFELKLGDFIFGMSGSLSNYAWVRDKDLPSYLNQRVGRIVARNKENQLFITYLYLSDKIQKTILDKAAGAAQLNISVSDLRSIKVEVPSSHVEQQKIASVLSSADREIELLQSKLTALKQEKKALMQQLLTGKRRVLVHIGKTEL